MTYHHLNHKTRCYKRFVYYQHDKLFQHLHNHLQHILHHVFLRHRIHLHHKLFFGVVGDIHGGVKVDVYIV